MPHAAAAALGRAVAWGAAACVAASVAAFAAWLLIAPTPTIKRSDSIKEGLKVADLPGSTTFAVLLTWASLLVATLATLALRRLGSAPRTPRAPASSWATKARPAAAGAGTGLD